MKINKITKWLIAMISIFGFLYIISNVLGPIIIPFTLFGFKFSLGGGMLCFPILFLITDIIGEVWGKEEANYAVKIGLIAQLLFLAFTQIGILIPFSPIYGAEPFNTVFGTSIRFVIASIVSYLISQSWDVWIFHKIRDLYINKHGSIEGGRWIWNNASTMTSQILDTLVYSFIAFGVGSLGISVAITTILVKWIIALLDTPFFYLFTNKLNALKQSEAI